MKMNMDIDDLTGNLFTWGPVVGLMLGAFIAGPVNAAATETNVQRASVTAVASAVISKGVGISDQKLTYGRLSSDYVRPQQSKQQCDEPLQPDNCVMYLMEIQ